MSRNVMVLGSVVLDALTGFATADNLEEGTLQVRMNNLDRSGGWDWTKKRRVSCPDELLAPYLLKRGDLLFNNTNSPELVGRAAAFPGAAEAVVFSNHFTRLRLDPTRADSRYVARWIFFQWQAGVLAVLANQWVNQAAISTDALLSLPVALPSLSAQSHVADLLDRVDALRSKRREALNKLNTLMQAAFVDIFGNPATNPKKLDIGSIADLLDSATYGTSQKAGPTGEFPVLRMNNITRSGEMDLSDLKYMDLPEDQWDRYLAEDGDVLFNRTNSAELVGKTGLYRGETPMAYAGYLIRLRVSSEHTPEYLWGFLNTGYAKRELRNMCKSIIGMANINAKEIQAMKIPLPPLALQQEFARRVEAIEKLKALQRASLAKMDELFASLQYRAFRGEL